MKNLVELLKQGRRSIVSEEIEGLSDFVLIDGTHKTNIYNLSLIVTTAVDSLG